MTPSTIRRRHPAIARAKSRKHPAPKLPEPSDVTITLAREQYQQLCWIRGAMHAMALCIRAIDMAFAAGHIDHEKVGFDTAGIYWLADEVGADGVLSDIIASYEQAQSGGAK